MGDSPDSVKKKSSRGSARSSSRPANLGPTPVAPKAEKLSKDAKVSKAAPRTQKLTVIDDEVRSLKRKIEESLDQLALIHGVLEELCERQEALATWQMEYAKRTLSLGEAQWQALNEFARRSGTRKKSVPPLEAAMETQDGFTDSLEDASEFLTELSGDLSRRREVRQRVMDERAADRKKANPSGPSEPQESILILPEKTDFH